MDFFRKQSFWISFESISLSSVSAFAGVPESNVTRTIRAIAGSIRSQSGQSIRRAELAAALLNAFGRIFPDLPGHQKSSHEKYLHDCLNLGQKVLVVRGGSEQEAEAIAVDPDFGLTVRYPDGSEETVRTGEVSVRGLYGYV